MAVSLGDALESDCRSSLCWRFNSKSRTVPNVSVYRPDYLFQTVTDVLGGHPSKSRYTTDLQHGPPIMALGNDPKQD